MIGKFRKNLLKFSTIMSYLKIQQVNFLGILLEWGPDPLRPLPTFCLSVFQILFISKFTILFDKNVYTLAWPAHQ